MNELTRELSHQYEIILASSSPRRYEIMTEQMGFDDLIIMKPNFEEDLDKQNYIKRPIEYARDTCKGKTLAILDDMPSSTNSRRKIIICADTIIVDHQDTIYEKPITKDVQLANILRFVKQDEPLRAITAVSVTQWNSKNNYKTDLFHEITEIHFDKSTPKRFIELYVESGDGLQVAGGIKVQGLSGCFIQRIDGDYYNVVGLPLNGTWKRIMSLVN